MRLGPLRGSSGLKVPSRGSPSVSYLVEASGHHSDRPRGHTGDGCHIWQLQRDTKAFAIYPNLKYLFKRVREKERE